MKILDQNKKAANDSGARANILYSNMLDQMRYIEALDYIKDKDVLDIACGIGWGSYLLSKGGAKSVKGIDLSEEAITSAQKYYDNNNINYLLGAVSKIPLESNSIDVVVSFETIEHVENIKTFLDEIFRVMRPNSLMILSTPNGYAFKKSFDSKPSNPYHCEEYSKTDIENLFDEKYWEILSYKGQHPMKESSKEIKDYRKFISYYWNVKKYKSRYGVFAKILFFLLNHSILKSLNDEPAYKDSCKPIVVPIGYQPAYHFFIIKCKKQ